MCAERNLCTDWNVLPLANVDCTLLCPPDTRYDKVPMSVTDYGDGMILDPDGIFDIKTGSPKLQVCRSCHEALRKGSIPPLAMANNHYLGPVPPELRDLTIVEEAMIALCRSKCWILQLNDENETESTIFQQGMVGHVIVYPQRLRIVARKLPLSVEDITSLLCVIFIGSMPPSDEWLRKKAKPLIVHGKHVRCALEWLVANNPLYEGVEIDNEVLAELEDNPILPFHIQHVIPSGASQSAAGHYDEGQDEFQNQEEEEITFENVVIADAAGNTSYADLKSAAWNHVKRNGGGYIGIPHNPLPANEFNNPSLFPMMYPTLFLYGLGGPKDDTRPTVISFKRNIKHFFRL